ncbi:MAG: hypothetical protein ACRDP3_17775 [Streptomyces sp.]|uniref:hypothetical protein n=1 Tax=Streptomyces sp. TaxID=1931 RepID=UPI003D6BE4B8
MSVVTDLLDEIRSQIENLQRTVVQDLEQPGASEERFRSLIGDAPEAVRDWYLWCDGTRRRAGQSVGDASFIPGYIFPSLEEAAEIRRNGRDDLDQMGNWLPLLISASTDLYAAVWDGTHTIGVAGVLEGEETELEYVTIEEMLTVFVSAYSDGAYVVRDGHLDVDDDRMDDVYRTVTGREPLY